ncbi:hypothetical protein V6N12_000036 [Hibiscus sabdariffa]|uniref:Uncharacterized protein n=1 Tax=Hibiscus sabdariffa TaxID=183260 RepID=A0ABR2ADF4_9ROSI
MNDVGDAYASDVRDASTCKLRDVKELRADIVSLKSLEEKMNAMRDEMTYALQKISKRIEGDGANILNKINRFLCNKFGDSSPRSDKIGRMYATYQDPPSESFKTPEVRSNTIIVSNGSAPRKAMIKDKNILKIKFIIFR